MIFIHSKNRIELLRKSLDKWVHHRTAKEFGIAVVVERSEANEYRRMLKEYKFDIDLISLKKSDRGVNYAHRIELETAVDWNLKAFITSDDDLYPRLDPERLLHIAMQPECFGVGAYRSNYGLLLGMKPFTGTYRVAARLGFGMIAYNVENLTKTDAFSEPLFGYGPEDEGMALKGIFNCGLPWLIDSDIEIKLNAYKHAPGGFSELMDMASGGRDLLRHQWHETAYRMYPGYVSEPDKCTKGERCKMSVQWRRMVKHFCDIDITNKKVPMPELERAIPFNKKGGHVA